MFFATYRNTLKTLLRSWLFWIILLLAIIVPMSRAMGENVRITVLDDNFKIVGYISDTDPEYELTYDNYIQTILNSTKGWIMLYAMPIFCIVSAMLILSRDYSDGFFEIEKSGGVKPSLYFLGRFSAIITVNIIVCLFISFLCLHYYYFSRGQVEGIALVSYFADSTIRLLRVFVCSMLPGILFYIGLIYCISSISQSVFFGAVVGLGFVLFEYGSKTFLMGRLPDIYHDYLTPNPSKLYQYWTFYDTEWFTEKTMRNPFTENQMLLSVGITVGIAVVGYIISYLQQRKRNI